jgi:hypothetical protein
MSAALRRYTAKSSIAIFAGLSLFGLSFAAAAGHRVRLIPKFTAGESFRYQIDTRSTTLGNIRTPIENPEGGSQVKQTTSMIVRLDVLDVQPDPRSARGGVRLRVTYEKSQSQSESDAYNPQASTLDEQYDRLEGRSMEFAVGPDGKLTDFKGLEDILPVRAAASSMLLWAKGLSAAEGFPAIGIVVGQKWENERPLEDTSLAGLSWRTESTYLRNEPCHPAPAKAQAAQDDRAKGDMCAVILTRLELTRHGSAHRDATPEEYRRNGLRTSGKWTGSGESLDSISLATGLLVSSTQNSTQDADYVITSTRTGSEIHQVGSVTSEMEIKLLPQASEQP